MPTRASWVRGGSARRRALMHRGALPRCTRRPSASARDPRWSSHCARNSREPLRMRGLARCVHSRRANAYDEVATNMNTLRKLAFCLMLGGALCITACGDDEDDDGADG